jgi:hypothetical protein
MRTWCFSLILAVAAASAIGCGSGAESVSVVPQETGARPILEEVSRTGQLGSGAMELRTKLEELRKTDEAKGSALLKDMDELETLKSESQIRDKAKVMLGKL